MLHPRFQGQEPPRIPGRFNIDTVDICRVPQARLDQVERDVIYEYARRGVTLRNITHALGNPAASSDLDWEVKRSDQLAWLNGSVWLKDIPERTSDDSLRLAKRPRYEALAARSDFDLLRELARSYVQLCVPRPRATEMTFWALSALPSTNRTTWPRLLAVSINKMETLVVGHSKGEPDRHWGFINVSRRVLTEHVGSMSAIARKFGCSFQERDYEAAGGDVLGLRFEHPQSIVQGLTATASPLVAAARELNLRLMRKCPTFQ